MKRSPYSLPDCTKIGVELEFTDAAIDTVYGAMKKLQSKLRHKVHAIYEDRINEDSSGKTWDVKYDYSVCETRDRKVYGGEIASPILDICKTSFTEVTKVVRLLNKSGAVYTTSTGLHIHIDISDKSRCMDRGVFLCIWHLMLYDIYQLWSGRVDGHYTHTLIKVNSFTRRDLTPASVLPLILSTNRVEQLFGDKNSALHFYSKDTNDEHKMIEIRVGQMEDDPRLIIAWVKLCLQMVNEAYQYDDILSFLHDTPNYSFEALNNRAPAKLRLTAIESQNLWESI